MNSIYIVIDQNDNATTFSAEASKETISMNIAIALTDDICKTIKIDLDDGTCSVEDEDVCRNWLANNTTWELDEEGDITFDCIPEYVIRHVNNIDEILDEVKEDMRYQVKHDRQSSQASL